MTIQKETEQKNQRDAHILFAIFGTLIILLIGLMWYIDYYADTKDPFLAIRAKSTGD